jgi:hypothetical protein
VGGADHVIAEQLQTVLQIEGNDRLVFDDEDSYLRSLPQVGRYA